MYVQRGHATARDSNLVRHSQSHASARGPRPEGRGYDPRYCVNAPPFVRITSAYQRAESLSVRCCVA